MAESNFPLKVNLIGNATSLNTALTGASARLRQFSAKAKALGSSLTTSLTLPLALIGGASIKMALDFDKSMTKIKTLVGIASDEVDAMGGAVKRLAVDTGVNANDAADALFFITSAGLRGADAMKVLEMSAKASAIGLGEVKTVADAVTSAVNAYGQENLSAESATDILTAAVREGKLEADALAQSMGKVLPTASALGVEFHEVGAAMAAMSRTGTDAAMASTSLNTILSNILSPVKQAKDELAKIGITSDDLRKSLDEDGLIHVLTMLATEFEGNVEATNAVFGSMRSLRGVLDLTGKNLGTTEQIFQRLTNTTGTLNTAVTELEDELSHQFKKSLEAVRTSFTELGKTLAITILPFIQKFAGFLTTLINKFNNLDTSTQNTILRLVAFTAALGPLILIISGLASAFSLLAAPVVLVSAAVIALILAFEHVQTNIKMVGLQIAKFASKAVVRLGTIGKAIRALFKGENINEVLADMDILLQGVDDKFDSMIEALDPLGESILEKISSAVGSLMDGFKQVGVGIGGQIGKGIDESLTKSVEKTIPKVLGKIGGGFGTLSHFIASSMGAVMTHLEEQQAKAAEIAKKQGDIINNAMGNIISQIGNSLSTLFAGGNVSAEKFAAGVLGILGDLAMQIGTMVILANKAVTEMLIPGLGMAAGFALIAIGAAMKGLSTRLQNEGVPLDGAFAKGGIISGPTVGLLGEYSGARHNPEVVAPLDKLKSMISSNGSQNLSGEFVVRGQDLVVALQRAERNRNRFK
ncbi:MAG: phage tail tape measure protein [Flavobacteriaceae bacterium]|jgi:TP901 family phage tail tape measure protein|nr:phage tail tape measure protein [Flavobacteriaceae bacterium]